MNNRCMKVESVTLVANIEALFTPSKDASSIEFNSRGGHPFRLAVESGETADDGNYRTISGSSPNWYTEGDNLKLNTSFYLRSSFNDIIEVIYFHP